MYFLLGISIALAALLTFNSLASLTASLLWRLVGMRTSWLSASNAAGLVFLLRILPIAAGIASVIFLLAPAYIEHEPRDTHEDVSAKLAIIAIASAIGLFLALFRGFAAWRATSRLTSDWLRHAEPIKLAGISIPTFRFEHQFPVIAIVGILRPRLFVASQIFTSLSPAELLAAIAHETGHVVARDNLKRGLMRACRDALVIIPCGRRLDHAWIEASESAADEFAASQGEQVALDLAAALVKIARLIPTGIKPAMPAGAFLLGNEEQGGVRSRVRRLMQLAKDRRDGKLNRRAFKMPMMVPIALTVAVAALAANEPHVLTSVHSLMEHAVGLLQ